MLHAHQLTIPHPLTQEKLTFTSTPEWALPTKDQVQD